MRAIAAYELEIQLPSESLLPLEDWGLLNDAEWLLKRYKRYRRTNQYPNGGAMDQQSKSLLDDFDRLDYLTDFWKQQLLLKPVDNGE